MVQSISILKNNFSSGEFSPDAIYRSDIQKYSDAVQLCKNFYPSALGGVYSRQGTSYINAWAKYDDLRDFRLVDFIYSSIDSYVLEIGYKYIRFFTNKEPVLKSADIESISLSSSIEITSTGHGFNLGTKAFINGVIGTTEINNKNFILGNVSPNTFILCDEIFGVRKISNSSQDNPCVITSVEHGLETGDVICIDDVVGMTELNGFTYTITKLDDDSFSLDGIDSTLFTAYEKDGEIRLAVDGSTYTPYISDGITICPYEVATDMEEEDVRDFDYTFINQNNKIVFVYGKEPKVLTRNDYLNWTYQTITFGPSIDQPVSVGLTATGAADIGYQYFVTAVTEYGEESFATSTAIVNGPDEIMTGWTATNRMNLTIQRVDNAAYYNIYRTESTSGYKEIGFINFVYQSTAGNISYSDAGYNVKDNNRSIPREVIYFNDTLGYPNRCTVYQQRLILARNRDLFFSQIKSFFNFNASNPIGATDSFSVTLSASGKASDPILWLVENGKYLLIGTTSKLYSISPYNNFVLEANSINVESQSIGGSSDIYPLDIGKYFLHIKNFSKQISEIFYSFDVNGFNDKTISLLFNHFLIDGIKRWSFKDDDDPSVFIVTNSGRFIVLSYIKNENILGAVEYVFDDGVVYDVENIPGDSASDTYVFIERVVNGKAKRYVEILEPRFYDNINFSDFIGVDFSVKIFLGSPSTLVTGLNHLIGKTVQVVADDIYVGEFIVNANGEITLENEASKILVGLKIVCEIQTLPVDLLSTNVNIQTIRNHVKELPTVRIGYINSLGDFKVGFSRESLGEEISLRSTLDPLNATLELKTGYRDVRLRGSVINPDCLVYVHKDKPFPLNMLYFLMSIEVKNRFK